MTTDDQSPILATAQELLASRMDVIPPLAEAIAERKRLQDLINATEKAYGAAYNNAQAAGWTPEELRQLGADEPTRRPQGRPKSVRTRRPRATASPTTPNPRTADPTESESSSETSTAS
ncbi:hypothetical protein OG275_38160 (plasmid) [Streptomyces niveus]|uniref:hypothetical protein n=1 Tax=Streptomyces niveus TaxID=193462 RepID=UPI002E3025C5|nr:hypothetical protein [Streptomyces niveus]